MEELTVGQLAKKAEINLETIRYYETINLMQVNTQAEFITIEFQLAILCKQKR